MTYHILIVDDEPIMREGLLRYSWEDYGFEAVGCCASGREALEWLSRHPVDLVLSDIKMPGIDGVELSGRIRELYPDLLVVLLTGYNEFNYAQQAIRTGVFDYLLKPAEDDDFERVLLRTREELRERENKRMRMDVMAYRFMIGNARSGPAAEHLSAMLRPPAGDSERFHIAVLTADDERWEAERQQPFANSGGKRNYVRVGAREWIARINGEEADILAESAGSGEPFRIGLSGLRAGPDTMRQALLEAIDALQGGFLHPEQRVFRHSESGGRMTDAGATVSELLRRAVLFAARINLLATGEIERSLAEMLDEMAASGASAGQIRHLVSAAVWALDAELTKLDFISSDRWARVRNDFLRRLEQASDFAAVRRQLLDGLCPAINGLIADGLPGRESLRLDEALRYIHERFASPLSLDDVACRMDMHPSSFSKWFKAFKGMNYIDYLTRYRIDRAKELLESGEMKTAGVAEAVGFQDARYFGQVFKRLVGMTPTEYRLMFSA